MAYSCPRCGAPVQRAHSAGAQAAAGLVGALFCAAFGAFQCPKCGELSRSEFPASDRTKMTVNSALMVVGALVLLGVVVWLITLVN